MITLFLPEKILDEYDTLVFRNIIANRSEALRQAAIEYLVKLKKTMPNEEEYVEEKIVLISAKEPAKIATKAAAKIACIHCGNSSRRRLDGTVTCKLDGSIRLPGAIEPEGEDCWIPDLRSTALTNKGKINDD